MERALLYGDTHIPFHDERALTLVEKLVRAVKPITLIHIGDLIDAWQISHFSKDPRRKDTLQENINDAAAHLSRMTSLAPRANRWYLEGNHEHRLTKAIWTMGEQQRALAGLDVFDRYVNWDTILEEAGAKGWDFVPVRGQARAAILPKLIVKHGSLVRKWSGASARSEWERYGRSGLSGHTHRLGVFYHRDYNGAHGWAETGCTCRLDPEYVEDPDWQQGCIIVTYCSSRFSFEPVYFQDGVAVWRDREFVA